MENKAIVNMNEAIYMVHVVNTRRRKVKFTETPDGASKSKPTLRQKVNSSPYL